MAYERRDFRAAAAIVQYDAPTSASFTHVTGFSAVEFISTGIFELTLDGIDLSSVAVHVTSRTSDARIMVAFAPFIEANKIRVFSFSHAGIPTNANHFYVTVDKLPIAV